MDHGRPVYSISAVARMLDVPVATLRTWEERYQQIVPARASSGRRLFTPDEVERLRFVLARMSEGATAADAHRILAGTAPAGGPAVLVAESDPYAAEFAGYFLAAAGYEVRAAIGEQAVLDAFAAVRPALVIVELLISGGSGLALCRYFRQHRGVAVIAVSAVRSGQAATAAGASAFLLKPLDPDELVAAVAGLLPAAPTAARSGARR